MENASKALIIAGAILLSILIIGLGMYIYNQAAGVMDTNAIDEVQMKNYNEPFEKYMGTNVSGSQVKNLYNAVRDHNISNQEDQSLLISINDKNIAKDLNADRAKIGTGVTYTVEVPDDGYDTKTGYIVKITVTENK